MSLYGALFTGVSALSAQSQSMGMISDNIANVNTIGYKRTEAAFSSLVTSQGRATAYAPGAVRASSIQTVNQQGTLQQSSSATDIALSGDGFFVVQSSPSGLSEPLYTRAGQFSEDSSGYLVNSSGYYLMGWPVDQDGKIPSGSGDVSSLAPVDVAFLGGITRPTTSAKISLNLDAGETPSVYPLPSPVTQTPNFSRSFRVYDSQGSGQDVTMNFYHTTSPTATGVGATDISGVTNLMDTYPNIASTAKVTGTADLSSGTLGSNVSGLTNGDSFVLTLNGQSATISVDTTWNASQFAAAINGSFSSSPASIVGGHLVLSAATPIKISSGGTQPITAAHLSGLGLAFGTTKRDPVTFTLQAGANAVQTVIINDGDSTADLVAHINALPDMNAQLDATGHLVVAADAAGQNLVLSGVGSAGQISTAGLADLGLTATTYSPPASPSLLTPLGSTADAQNWWQVDFLSPDGQVLNSGMVNFNGDGSVNSNDKPALVNLSNVDWGNGSNAQTIGVDVTNFTQYSGNYNVVSTDQNGAELGLRTGVTIDKDGYISATFSNGQSTKLYKLPIATFANANGLIAKNGNAYQSSDGSGEYNLREAGVGSAGTVQSSTLEASNVDIADEFSKMIVTQRAYSAGTKVITTTDQMLQDLLQLR